MTYTQHQSPHNNTRLNFQKKILIANRGEIACRVIRAAKAMGIATVAVYSDVDRHARHVVEADQAVCIGEAVAAHSYLNVAKIIATCQKVGADALHPGYGFLSENADFTESLMATGVTFIVPPAAAIRVMGDKITAISPNRGHTKPHGNFTGYIGAG